MVAVKSHEADRFAGNRPAGIWIVLVHGSDHGLVSERARTLAAAAVGDPKDPFQLVHLDADQLAADPGRLVDEIRTVPLFGERRAIRIEAGSKNLAPAIAAALEMEPPSNCVVIIEVGLLKRDAPLRGVMERARHGAAIECVADTTEDLGRLIDSETAAAGLRIDGEAREALVRLLGADRLTTRSEIDKLVLYAHGSTRIGLDDVEAVVADASATVQEAAIDGAFVGDFLAIETTVGRVLSEGGDAGVLVGAALRHAVALHRCRLDVDGRRSVTEVAGAAARFGIYFKRKAVFERQLKSWTAPKLARAIDTLAEAVGRCRREARLAPSIAVRALWSVALAVRGS